MVNFTLYRFSPIKDLIIDAENEDIIKIYVANMIKESKKEAIIKVFIENIIRFIMY